MYFANGHYVRINNLDASPSLSKDQAVSAFLKYKQIGEDKVHNSTTRLLIKEIESKADQGRIESVNLVYRIYLESDDPNNNEVGYVDAHTGTILMTEPLTTGLLGTFATRYSGIRMADTDPVGAEHRLFDNTRGANIHTRSLQNNSVNIGTAVELLDNDNNWTTGEHGANNDDMGLDVHWGLQAIYDYLNNTHGINSFDDAGHPIEAYVRYGNSNGTRDWAGYFLDDHFLVFGQGHTDYSPLASLDVVAHEYGHGISDFQIGWTAAGLQASFHEGLSDIWGAILEQRIRPNSMWHMGEQIDLGYSYTRNLENTKDNNARTKMANTFESTDYNNGGVYERSGVFSHWFYMITEGKSGFNDHFDSYQVPPMGLDKAEALIVEAVFNNYLDGTTTWPGIRAAMIAAGQALFCEYDYAHKSIADGWYAVGVGSPYSGSVTTLSGPNFVCTTGNYSANNVPSGATVTWSSTNPSAVSINSSTGVATKIASGPAQIVATISGPCGPSYKVAKHVFSGAPDPNRIYVTDGNGNLPIILDNYGTITAKAAYLDDPFIAGISQFQWNVPNGNVTQTTWLQSPAMREVDIFYSNGMNPSTQQVYIRAENDCGWGLWDELVWEVDNSFFFAYTIHPNPAKEKLYVSFEKADRVEGLPKTISLFNEKSNIPIQQIDVWSKFQQAAMANNQIVFDVSGLARGRYFLHIEYDNGKSKTAKHQVVLE